MASQLGSFEDYRRMGAPDLFAYVIYGCLYKTNNYSCFGGRMFHILDVLAEDSDQLDGSQLRQVFFHEVVQHFLEGNLVFFFDLRE